MGKISGLHDVIATLENMTGAAERLEESYRTSKNDRESGMREYYSKEINRYWGKTKAVFLFCIVVWLTFIIATIVLCIQGNDIVLRWLSL